MAETITFESASWRRQSHLSALVILVGMLGGFVTSIGAVSGVRTVHAIQALRWPSVPGVVTRSEVRDDTLTVNPRRSGRVGLTTARRFYVTYAYSIAGVRYASSRFDALTPRGADLPSRNLERYPIGATVTVHVDPQDATQAFLEAPIPVASAFTAAIGLAFGASILGWVWGELRRVRRAAPSNER